MTSTNFEKYGDKFQAKLLYIIITDKSFILSIYDTLKPEYFTNENFEHLYNMILEYFNKYYKVPDFDSLEIMVESTVDDELKKNYLLKLLAILKDVNVINDSDYVVDETYKFCKQQSVRSAILNSVSLLKTEEYDKIYDIVQNALNSGIKKDLGHDYITDVKGRLMEPRRPIATGLKYIDEYSSGGLSDGELGIILAGTGVGKSMILASIAGNAFLQGKTVLYYTLELSENMVGLRLDSKFTKYPLSTIMQKNTPEFREIIEKKIYNLGNQILEKTGSKPNLIIKHYPAKSATVNTLRNHYNTILMKGTKPDIIIVDYADLLKPMSRYNDKRFELQDLSEELRGFADEVKNPLWSASQTNREGLDTNIVSMKTISESLGKAMTADLMVSIGRDHDMVESDRACYYLLKNRFGPDKLIFTGPFDTSILEFDACEKGLETDQEKRERHNDTVTNAIQDLLKKK